MLVLFALLATFVLMITAITHQFRGWLHLLMVNKRRRRTIIAVVTAVFILLVQLPNIINIAVQRGNKNGSQDEQQTAIEQLQEDLAKGEIDSEQYDQRVTEIEKEHDEKRKQEQLRLYRKVVNVAAVVNVILPIGWLPFGARAAAQGSVLPGLLGALAAGLIGFGSLWRSYQTTLRFYTSGFNARQRKQTRTVDNGRPETVRNLLEKRIAGVPEQAAIVALGGLRSLLRAPEGKMLLLTPIILLAIFGMMFVAGRERNVPEMARPFLGLGAISLTMLCFVQVQCNMFGFDRDGFRAFVLSPCRRQDILLGKNLSIAPLAVGVCCVGLILVQIFVPMRVTHVAATLLQMTAGFVIFCVLGNLISIVAPSAISVGSLKPAKAKFATVLIHILAALLSPVVLVPAVVAYGIELLLEQLGWRGGVPVYLLLSIAELALVVWVYRALLPAEGGFLQRREKAILDTVTARAE
jgi:uncharacterized membrane protein